MNRISNCSMHELYQHTLERTDYLKKEGIDVVEMWECQVARAPKKEPRSEIICGCTGFCFSPEPA